MSPGPGANVRDLGTIDNERDLTATLIIAPDYNGEPVGTVICAGYPVLTVMVDYWPGGQTRDQRVITDGDPSSAHTQAAVTFLWNVGDYEEDAYEQYVNNVGGPAAQAAWEEFGSATQGYGLLGWIDDVYEGLNGT